MERWALLRHGKRGHKWLAWFTDLDRSGVSIDRPALNDARDLAVEHRAAIVVFDLATYSRLVPEGLSALERLAAEEVTVISASEDLDATPPEGELSPTMFLAMSQYQVRRIGASWRNVIDRNKREGWWHGVVPYGYRRPTAKEAAEIGRRAGVIVPDETTAPHVRELSRRYLEGESWYALGILAVERGWFSRRATAKDILTNAVADLASGLRTEARDRAERELRAERKGRAEDRSSTGVRSSTAPPHLASWPTSTTPSRRRRSTPPSAFCGRSSSRSSRGSRRTRNSLTPSGMSWKLRSTEPRILPRCGPT